MDYDWMLDENGHINDVGREYLDNLEKNSPTQYNNVYNALKENYVSNLREGMTSQQEVIADVNDTGVSPAQSSGTGETDSKVQGERWGWQSRKEGRILAEKDNLYTYPSNSSEGEDAVNAIDGDSSLDNTPTPPEGSSAESGTSANSTGNAANATAGTPRGNLPPLPTDIDENTLANIQAYIDNNTAQNSETPVALMTNEDRTRLLSTLDACEEAMKEANDTEGLQKIQQMREQLNAVEITTVSNNPQISEPNINTDGTSGTGSEDDFDPNALFENSDQTYDSEQTKEILNKLQISTAYIEDILSAVNDCAGKIDSLHDIVKSKLAFTASDFEGALTSKVNNNWNELLEAIIGNIKEALGIADDTEAHGNDPAGTIDGTLLGNSYNGGSYTGSSSGDIPQAPNVGDVPVNGDTTILPGDDTLIASSVAGLLTFTGLLPLYDEIGGVSNIQGSLTSQYQVVEIINENGTYYYKIYDPELKRFFYAEINESSLLTTDYKQLLISKEGEPTMMLTEPKVGEEVFSKLTEPNKAYFVISEEPVVDENGIQFAPVLDGSDGNVYYVPLDDTVQMVNLDSIVPTVFETSSDGSDIPNDSDLNNVTEASSL